jgi:acyl-CoA synthetase (AMP-forming)/AMP-acid ligase II
VINGGGAPFPPELLRLVNSRLPHASITVGYGTSETFGTGTRLSGSTLATHPASVGSVEPLCEVKIQGPGGDVLADGEIGEIHIRGPAIFLGYWNDPKGSAAALDQRRWYATGDYGHFSDGVLYLESRMRDMIIRGGENIYPIEIENRLISHPAVAEACVVGVPHVQLGQDVVAVVVLHPTAHLEADELRSWAGVQLAVFKVPRFVIFRDALPYNATGKVLKVVVEADVRAELEPFLIDH